MTCGVMDPRPRGFQHGGLFNHRVPTMQTSSSRFLRIVLAADAASCIASGALQLAALDALVQLLALPRALLLESGLFLVAYGIVVGVVATRSRIPRALVALFALGNLGWAAGCVGLLGSGLVQPAAPGVAWVLMQALTVVVLAVLQARWWMGSAHGTQALAA